MRGDVGHEANPHVSIHMIISNESPDNDNHEMEPLERRHITR